MYIDYQSDIQSTQIAFWSNRRFYVHLHIIVYYTKSVAYLSISNEPLVEKREFTEERIFLCCKKINVTIGVSSCGCISSE